MIRQTMGVDIPPTKTCRGCQLEKPADAFYRCVSGGVYFFIEIPHFGGLALCVVVAYLLMGEYTRVCRQQVCEELLLKGLVSRAFVAASSHMYICTKSKSHALSGAPP